MISLQNKSVLVLGLGETGLSLARHLVAQGATVRVADSREMPPAFAALRVEMPQIEIHLGGFHDETFDGIDLIAISPGVALAQPQVASAIQRGIPVVGDIELFAHSLPQIHPPKIIAITGANGKTTVTTLVGDMCRAAGLDTAVAGNISPAVLDVLHARGGQQPDVWVLELSSFQLETTATLNADAATVLNISEDHLDRYAGMSAYAAAKARIFAGHGAQILNRDDALSLSMALPGRAQVSFGLNLPSNENDWGVLREGNDLWLVQGSERLLNTAELQIVGLHNAANALAALALCRSIGLPLLPLLAALRNFRGLPHRVERVTEIGGVEYYDDSKGTNVGATVAALQGLGRPAVLIAGGEGKEQNFAPLAPIVAQYARAVVLIGHDADKIAAALSGCKVPLLHARDMDDAVRQAAQQAQPGDAVLLSPACASFDMFRNYEHRAEVFVGAVYKLKAGASCAQPL
jgi:UDP-N-acetylmuramoylalanine--D-glutamate ligase